MEASQPDSAFTVAYQALNLKQKVAVDTIEGPVMVIAGPGTGKTQILTLRIANILLQTDTAPESILALTFTESGAKVMRERLRRYIGARAYRVSIYTFHGFAERLIRDYPGSYDQIVGGRPIGDVEKIRLIESLIDSADIKTLRPAGDSTYYVTPIIRMIAELKKEYVVPDTLARIITEQEISLNATQKIHEKGAHIGKVRGEYTKLEHSIIKNRELLLLYRLYEASLRSHKWYDFEDMIVETVKALGTDESMLRDLQEQFHYILADEHQDVNGAQNRILELLASYHDQPNIFVVGDEKQAIYRFQGASLENFLYFENRFPGTTLITLTENYRSGQLILDAAHSLVAVEAGPLSDLRIPLTSALKVKAIMTKRQFSHQAIEIAWLAEAVKASIVAGTKPREIAIIVRTNKEVELIAERLRKQEILVEASADGDILAHPIMVAVEALLTLLSPMHNEQALFTLIHGAYWRFTADDIFRLGQARTYGQSLLALLRDEERLQEIGVINREAATLIPKLIETARSKEITLPPHRVLEYLLQASGLLDFVMIHDPLEGTRVLRRLFDEVENLVMEKNIRSLAAIAEIFAARRSYNLPMTAPYIVASTEAVHVMTAHKAKGLEFTEVFIPYLQDTSWGGGTKRTYFSIPLGTLKVTDTFDMFDDERRLLYVALTRAKERLHLSCADASNARAVLQPSRLFEEIDPATITVCATDTENATFNPLIDLTQPTFAPSIDLTFLTKVLATRGFSATSLNNYLSNPWDYVYRNVLRIPEVQSTHLQFGTVIHAVLEFATKYHTSEGRLPSATMAKAKLEQALGHLPLSQTEFMRLLERGLVVLYPYFDHLARVLPAQTKEELRIKVLLKTGIPELPELPLSGTLDRLDIGADGRTIHVVDYKTGKPKTRNVIEGKTKSGDGAYKRQLVFYALLLSLYDDDRYRTRTGVLSFVEPDTTGQVKEETFIVTDADIIQLQTEIITATQSILHGTFLTDQVAAQASQYAHLIRQL